MFEDEVKYRVTQKLNN